MTLPVLVEEVIEPHRDFGVEVGRAAGRTTAGAGLRP